MADYNCRTCGACCAPTLPSTAHYVELTRRDTSRLPVELRAKISKGRFRRYLPTVHNASGDTVCIALRGAIGKRVRCAVYAARPAICAAFEPGSDRCQDARAERGLPL